MKTTNQLVARASGILVGALVWVGCQTATAEDWEQGLRWRGWVDIGGTFGASANMTEFDGPVSGQELRLSPGMQFDLGFGYRLTPWLQLGGELGMTFNEVDSFGDFYWHDSSLFQMPIMANVRLEYPYWGPVVPYIGGGIGGVASWLTFGEHWDWEPDGTGSDFVLGFEAFAGLRFRLTPHSSLGVVYRFTATESQNWDVEWWEGSRFHVATDSLQLHSVCLVFTGTF